MSPFLPRDEYRGFRGGSFNIYENNLLASDRFGSFPTLETYSFGFRVAEVPEPATLAVLAFGSAALVRRGRTWL